MDTEPNPGSGVPDSDAHGGGNSPPSDRTERPPDQIGYTGASGLEHVVRDSLPRDEALRYNGYTIYRSEHGHYEIALSGHAGVIDTVRPSDFDIVHELVDYINYFDVLREAKLAESTDELVEWAGKWVTSYEPIVEQTPEYYVHKESVDRPTPGVDVVE